MNLHERWQVRDWLTQTLYTLLQPVECNGVSESVYEYLVDWWFEQPQAPTPESFCTQFTCMLQSDFDAFGDLTVQSYLYNREVRVADIESFFTRASKPSLPLRTLSQKDGRVVWNNGFFRDRFECLRLHFQLVGNHS